jgi:hypothetical protein
MKTKYSPLLKYKQSEVDKLQNHLHELNNMIREQQELIRHSKEQINLIKKPTSGSFRDFANTQDIMIVQKIDQNIKLARELELEDEKSWILGKIKEANIELEKMKYLHNQEKVKKAKEIKQKEDNEMNEISTILFNNRSAS